MVHFSNETYTQERSVMVLGAGQYQDLHTSLNEGGKFKYALRGIFKNKGIAGHKRRHM